MDAVLIVHQGDDTSEELFESAKTHVTGTGKEVIIYNFINKNKVKRDLQRQAQPDRTIEEMKKSAEKETKTIAEDIFEEEIPYTVIDGIGNVPEDIIQVTGEYGCEHIFINGRKRSPAGKAIFGDTAQSVILEFDGPVTVTTTN